MVTCVCGTVESATVYCSLIAWDSDETTASDVGWAAEWGLYADSTVCDGVHVWSACIRVIHSLW